MENSLPSGTQIKCPRKRHLIGLTNKAISTDIVMPVSFIDFEEGQERVAGEIMACKLCSSMYFIQGKIYTELSWFPNEPQLETPIRG